MSLEKEPEGGSKKRKEVGNDNSLASMFRKQQTTEQGRSNVYCHLSGLEDAVLNDFIKDDFIPEANGQVASGSAPFLTL